MGYGKITAKQQQILDYIKQEILNRGYPPTVREICETVNLKSTSSVHSHLETLEKNGYIRRDPTKPRAIEICDDSFQMVRTEMVSLPIVGQVAAGTPILAEQNIQDYFPVGSGDLPIAINRSLKQMSRGEEMRVIAPWYTAYGAEGTALIKPYSNLIITLTTIEE